MSNTPKKHVQNRDYYIESGKWIFTAFFLRQRGFCCDNKCRHCPYKSYGKQDPPNVGDNYHQTNNQ